MIILCPLPSVPNCPCEPGEIAAGRDHHYADGSVGTATGTSERAAVDRPS